MPYAWYFIRHRYPEMSRFIQTKGSMPTADPRRRLRHPRPDAKPYYLSCALVRTSVTTNTSVPHIGNTCTHTHTHTHPEPPGISTRPVGTPPICRPHRRVRALHMNNFLSFRMALFLSTLPPLRIDGPRGDIRVLAPGAPPDLRPRPGRGPLPPGHPAAPAPRPALGSEGVHTDPVGNLSFVPRVRTTHLPAGIPLRWTRPTIAVGCFEGDWCPATRRCPGEHEPRFVFVVGVFFWG